MKRTMIALFGALLVMLSGAALAADDDDEMTRSVGAFPVAHDDYPASAVVVSITDDYVLTVTGEGRVRFEWIENTIDFSDNGLDDDGDDDPDFDDSYDFMPARFNVGFRVDMPRQVAAVIELQGAWDLGGNDEFATDDRAFVNQALRPGAKNPIFLPEKPGGFGSNTTGLDEARGSREAATDSVRVYQGYLEMANIGDSIFSMRFGRQELAYGTEFLLGNQDWYDGLSWDGAKGIWQFSDDTRLDVFYAKVAERNLGTHPDGHSEDWDLYGAYATINGLGETLIGLDAYVIGTHDAEDKEVLLDTTDGLTIAPGAQDDEVPGSFLDAWWAGIRVFRDVEHGLHFSAELTYLWGDMEADLDNSFGDKIDELDISAWAFEGFIGYTFDTPTNPTIKGGVTLASGSSWGDVDSGDWNTFFTPAGEIHPRLGLMDLIEAQNVNAFTLGYSGSNGNHAWGVDLWHFEMDETDPFIDSELGATVLNARDGFGFDDELGREIDLWYNYQYSRNLVLQFAIGLFDAGDFIEQANGCDTDGDGDADGDLSGNNGCDHDLLSDNGGVGTDDAIRATANLLLRF